MKIQTINPTTGELLKEYEEFDHAKVEQIINKAQQTFLTWSQLSFAERTKKMLQISDYLLKEKEALAMLMTKEMGKPLTAGMAEIEKCALVCRHYAEHAEDYLEPRLIQTEMKKSYVCYKPTGVIFNIMPWNFPFWQVFRFAAPNIMAGNTAILRHAPCTTGCGIAIEQAFKAVGFPEGVFSTIIVSNEQAAMVIAHPKIAGVTLTGSERAGRIVGAEAAGALKKVVLELGGSDPYIILEDADLDLAADLCTKSRLANAGQVCISAKRFIIIESVYEQFKQKIIEKMQHYKPADPMQAGTNFGPMARKDLREQLQQQVEKSIAQGAKLVMGGKPIEGAGYFYPPTILENIPKGSPAYEDEMFGPVACLFKASNEEEAIQIANDTRFGLGAGVFTRDLARGEKIARDKIQTGTCVVNTTVASDPRLPFGGTKGSGYGRELSAEGIREFMNVKTISIN